MNTTKKYTIILSAFQNSASYSENLAATDSLQKYLEYVLYLNIESAVGHYKGGEEISFVIHTDQLTTVQHLSEYALNYLGQECTLVSNNARASIALWSLNGRFIRTDEIGSYFVPNKGDGENYTRLGGKYWSVAA